MGLSWTSLSLVRNLLSAVSTASNWTPVGRSGRGACELCPTATLRQGRINDRFAIARCGQEHASYSMAKVANQPVWVASCSIDACQILSLKRDASWAGMSSLDESLRCMAMLDEGRAIRRSSGTSMVGGHACAGRFGCPTPHHSMIDMLETELPGAARAARVVRRTIYFVQVPALSLAWHSLQSSPVVGRLGF